MATVKETIALWWTGPRWKRGLLIAGAAAAALLLAFAAVALLYHGIRFRVYHELGEPVPPASVFLKGGGVAAYAEEPELSAHGEGNYLLTIVTGSRRRKVLLTVRDTRPPQAEDAQVQVLPGEKVDPPDVLKNVWDASILKMRWVEPPELDSPGMHPCCVLLTDSCGNETRADATVYVVEVAEHLDYVIGTERPEASDFITGWDGEVRYVTDTDGIDWRSAGTVPVVLALGDERVRSSIRLLDESSPALTLCTLAVERGAPVKAADLVESCDDESAVTFRFAKEPDLTRGGMQAVTVIASDSAGNETRAEGTLLLCDRLLVLEARRDSVTVSSLVARLGEDYVGYYGAETEHYTPDTLGYDSIRLTNWAEEERVLGLYVTDTTPPAAELPLVRCYTGYPRDPADFAGRITDASAVTVEFTEEPDWNTVGEAAIHLRLTDAEGNTALAEGSAVFVPDTQPPEIAGARDRYYYVGDAVSYFQGVLARDNADPDCTLEVDKSAVNYRAEGDYPVTWTATDRDGNSSSATAVFHFAKQSVTDEQMDALAEEIFSEILTDGMSLAEQAKAVYDYIHHTINYIGTSDKSDWKANVYKGFHDRLGDCYTFCYSSYFLLNKLGADTVVVQRANETSRHFWLLVNLGTGWYHFDAGRTAPGGYQAFMKTTEQIYSVQDGDYYWHFDPDLYPEVATVPFEMF
ncbi:MAG: transglutaminase domain-containing protein [Oscillospiraceae bacterium]|nr:transglutaminase domain-containing protein [Oscillospiraceae bacterium]